MEIDFADPLKHEARLSLWLPALQRLKNQVKRNLKYFSLPGQKAYDVIKWRDEKLIEFDGKGFPGVCFCEMDAGYFTNAKRVLGNTRGIKSRFEDIMNNLKDQRYKAFWDLFPYDVYNLDFCNTWFEGNEPLSETFTSIIRLVNHHVMKRYSGNFLLLLTIRIDQGRTNPKVVEDLKDNLISNRDKRGFSDKINGLVGTDIEQFVSGQFHKFIMIGIPKLIGFKLIPQTRRFYGKIEDLDRGYYRRNGYYIGKFVFSIGKDKADLKTNPSWYSKCVDKSLDWTSVLEITKDTVSTHTKTDLEILKKELKKIENY